MIQLVFDLQTSKVRIDESRSFLFEYNYILCFEEFEQDKICFSILNNSDQMFIVDLKEKVLNRIKNPIGIKEVGINSIVTFPRVRIQDTEKHQ